MPSLEEFFDIGDASPKKKIIGGAAAGVTVLCLFFLIFYMFSGDGPSRPAITQTFYFDLGTGKLVALEPNTPEHIPGFIGDSGKPMALAFVYDCGECSEDSRWIGHLEMYTAEALEIAKQYWDQDVNDPTIAKKLTQGFLVGTVENKDDLSKWVSKDQKEGSTIVNQGMKKKSCSGGDTLVRCRP